MNIVKIFTLGMTFYNLNKGMAEDGKKIMKEGMDVLQVMSSALKDNTMQSQEKFAHYLSILVLMSKIITLLIRELPLLSRPIVREFV